jgi:hypothetical protein
MIEFEKSESFTLQVAQRMADLLRLQADSHTGGEEERERDVRHPDGERATTLPSLDEGIQAIGEQFFGGAWREMLSYELIGGRGGTKRDDSAPSGRD